MTTSITGFSGLRVDEYVERGRLERRKTGEQEDMKAINNKQLNNLLNPRQF
jgi:hypothetical protein